MRVVFMGTPDFATPSLMALIEGPDDVVAVITQPDRAKGRHGELSPPPVKILAQQNNIPVYQPEKVKDKGFLPQLKALNPDVIVVVAYGQILSREILDVPPRWCINIHASLLPKYRGSAPINWALINGEKVTGVTSMIVSAALDSGPILLKKAEEIRNRIRGLIPWPGTYTYLSGTMLKIFKAEVIGRKGTVTTPPNPIFIKEGVPKAGTLVVESGQYPKMPGTVLEVNNEGIIVVTGEGYLSLKELQLEGKRRMGVAEFIRGYKIEKGM